MSHPLSRSVEDATVQEPARAARDVWDQIEQLELTIRSYVYRVFAREWPGREVDQMQQVLGTDKWIGIARIKDKASKNYRLSPDRTERSEMECMYLGDLADLILSNRTWQYFKDNFRDKRQLQDLIAAISPVRNDRAHFAATVCSACR